MSHSRKCAVCGQSWEEHNRPHMFEEEPLLYLSEIEARLTPSLLAKAEDAYDDAVEEWPIGESTEARNRRLYRAWLDVILAALGKEQP